MDVHSSDDVEEYAAAARGFLEADPCARNVLASVIDTVRATPSAYTAAPSFWWITDGGVVAGAASWTPPYNLLVSSLPVEAAADLAGAALARANAIGLRPHGVVGPAAPARLVADAWTAITDDTIEHDRPILLNVLATLTDVPRPEGSRRRGTAADLPLIAAWLKASSIEIGHGAPPNPLTLADHMVSAALVDLWVVGGRIVSLVGHRDSAGVVRVGPVYTPPEHRNHGYARRLTYEVTAEALQRPGIHDAMLFTDAANPVSNSIYRQAGYQPRGEHVEIDFAKRGGEPGH